MHRNRVRQLAQVLARVRVDAVVSEGTRALSLHVATHLSLVVIEEQANLDGRLRQRVFPSADFVVAVRKGTIMGELAASVLGPVLAELGLVFGLQLVLGQLLLQRVRSGDARVDDLLSLSEVGRLLHDLAALLAVLGRRQEVCGLAWNKGFDEGQRHVAVLDESHCVLHRVRGERGVCECRLLVTVGLQKSYRCSI